MTFAVELSVDSFGAILKSMIQVQNSDTKFRCKALETIPYWSWDAQKRLRKLANVRSSSAVRYVSFQKPLYLAQSNEAWPQASKHFSRIVRVNVLFFVFFFAFLMQGHVLILWTTIPVSATSVLPADTARSQSLTAAKIPAILVYLVSRMVIPYLAGLVRLVTKATEKIAKVITFLYRE